MNYPFNLQEELASIRTINLYRHRQILDSPQGIEIESTGKRYLNFSSNDYLGLANHPDLVVARRTAVDQYGVGTSSMWTFSSTSCIRRGTGSVSGRYCSQLVKWLIWVSFQRC